MKRRVKPSGALTLELRIIEDLRAARTHGTRGLTIQSLSLRFRDVSRAQVRSAVNRLISRKQKVAMIGTAPGNGGEHGIYGLVESEERRRRRIFRAGGDAPPPGWADRLRMAEETAAKLHHWLMENLHAWAHGRSSAVDSFPERSMAFQASGTTSFADLEDEVDSMVARHIDGAVRSLSRLHQECIDYVTGARQLWTAPQDPVLLFNDEVEHALLEMLRRRKCPIPY